MSSIFRGDGSPFEPLSLRSGEGVGRQSELPPPVWTQPVGTPRCNPVQHHIHICIKVVSTETKGGGGGTPRIFSNVMHYAQRTDSDKLMVWWASRGLPGSQFSLTLVSAASL